MLRVIQKAKEGMQTNQGGPFGAAVVKGDELISLANNQVTSTFDPTAHAEVVAIRLACERLQTFSLAGCELYTSCEPCPMCLAAAYWARIDRIYFAATRADAKNAGFDDEFFYEQICLPLEKRHIPMVALLREEAVSVFELWNSKSDKVIY